MHKKVEQYIARQKKWNEEIEMLREIVVKEKALDEDFKWMHPCYTLGGKNIVIIQDFKAYCALLFVKGALMKDPEGLLIQMTKNVQAARQLRFEDLQSIKKNKSVIQSYLKEAIEIERAGKKVKLKKTSDYEVPEEFETELNKSKKLKTAFEALTPGRQRAYLYHFAQAKKSETRQARVEKYIPQILEGKGIND